MNYLISPRYSINKRGGKRQQSSKQPPAIIQIKENLVMSTLFTAVSVEQQEIVAGGYDIPSIDGAAAVFFSDYYGESTKQYGGTYAGYNGAGSYGWQNIGKYDSSSLAAFVNGTVN
ncbi:MAG: hypothetical protein ACKPFD_06600 [Dolichospermum sp.]